MDEELNLIPEEEQIEQEETIVRNFATVGGLYDDGLSLIFDGETEPTQKHYLCNQSCTFRVGDRVRIVQDSGTYVVEYVVGKPIIDDVGNATVAQTVSDSVLNTYGSAKHNIRMYSESNRDVYFASDGGRTFYRPRTYGVINSYYSDYYEYDIRLRSASNPGAQNPTFQISVGGSVWKTISTT